MTLVTLIGLFEELDGLEFPTRQRFERAFLDIFNRHVTELPVGYSYMDAIEAARAEGWLRVNGKGHGVKVCLRKEPALAG